MNGKYLFGLPATACFLLAISANAVTTSKNVDIVVTHGASGALTTYTIQNTSLSTWLPNTPYIGGQSFRRGDIIATTNSIKIRDAVSHADLIYQLDEIATRRENGDDGSIRHLVFSFLFPASSPQYTSGGIPAGGTYQIEFVPTGAPYSMPSTHQTLAGLCTGKSGGPYHDLNLVLTDVRNQDELMRGPSGHAGTLTFDVCANIANTGRDAPRQVAQGAVRDTYIVSGAPAYSDGSKDPLLYVQAYLDLTTQSDGATPGPVRHIFRVDSPWMNVTAGSTGNSGAPGPMGFGDGTTGPAGGGTAGSGHGDPQAISYRPTLYDGAAALLDWSWWDASVSSSSNPIQLTGDSNNGTSCDLGSAGNWTIPASDGANAWFMGQASRYSTTGTPPAGMTSGSLYFIHPCGSEYSNPTSGPDDYPVIELETIPYYAFVGTNYAVVSTTQGTGTQTFSYRVWQPVRKSWYTTDQTGLENWALPGSTARITTPLLPAFASSEQLYWKETGTIPPMRITTTPTDPTAYGNFLMNYYQPVGKCNVIGGSGVGGRSDIGLFNEFMAQAFLVESAATWQRARVFALCGDHYPAAVLLNEATGRVPVLNYGPAGTNHAGAGGSYPVLGAPFSTSAASQVVVQDNPVGIAKPLTCTPVNDSATTNYCANGYGAGFQYSIGQNGNDHYPSFANGMYQFFGSRHYLDAIYAQGTRETGDIGQGPDYRTQDNIVNGVHYYGLHAQCCEERGTYWSHRDKLLAAAFGADSNPERTYFNDMLAENYYYDVAVRLLIDPTGNLDNSLFGVDMYFPQEAGTFIQSYGATAAYQGYAMLHDPLSLRWLQKWGKMYNAECGETDNIGISSYFCGPYYKEGGIHNAAGFAGYQGSIGWPYGAVDPSTFNGTDASDWGVDWVGQLGFTAGSANVTEHGNPLIYPPVVNGDKVMQIGYACPAGNSFCSGARLDPQPDELTAGTWYTIANVNATNGTFQIVCPIGHAVTSTCPTPGSPFTSFTISGNPASGNLGDFKFRPITATQPSTGFLYPGGAIYVQTIVYGLQDLGFGGSVSSASTHMAARGFQDPGPTGTAFNWDPNVTVP